jgi:hypothetical protein
LRPRYQVHCVAVVVSRITAGLAPAAGACPGGHDELQPFEEILDEVDRFVQSGIEALD